MIPKTVDEDISAILAESPELRETMRQNRRRWRLSSQLVAARRGKGLTQSEVAKRAGMDQAQVSRIESVTAAMPAESSIRRYLEACGLVPGYVWGERHEGHFHVVGAVALSEATDAEQDFDALIDQDTPLPSMATQDDGTF